MSMTRKKTDFENYFIIREFIKDGWKLINLNINKIEYPAFSKGPISILLNDIIIERK